MRKIILGFKLNKRELVFDLVVLFSLKLEIVSPSNLVIRRKKKTKGERVEVSTGFSFRSVKNFTESLRTRLVGCHRERRGQVARSSGAAASSGRRKRCSGWVVGGLCLRSVSIQSNPMDVVYTKQ